ncbi:hypothetical protein RF11_09457 [Thelohanellus kitauei]|uniref:Uncharacterized protein n=1 Tax=Thelohanellus kitauei TaxID=669202 RepID=A0A0C2MVH6_THEKT|nr:hypothetical protein RF11_09457 [Thelohanellus kitauei]
MKSSVILKIPMTSNDKSLFETTEIQLVSYPCSKLHVLYLNCRILVDILNSQQLRDSDPNNTSRMIDFANNLLLAISDPDYISKIQTEEKLFTSLINDDFIKNVFADNENILIIDIQKRYLEEFDNAEYEFQARILAWILHSFNHINYLHKSTADKYSDCIDVISKMFSNFHINSEGLGSDLDSHNTTNISAPKYRDFLLSFEQFLRCFMMIYEYKFIFGDINSKLDKLNLS